MAVSNFKACVRAWKIHLLLKILWKESKVCVCSINYYYHSAVFHLHSIKSSSSDVLCEWKTSSTCIFLSLHPFLWSMNECTNESSSLAHDQLFFNNEHFSFFCFDNERNFHWKFRQTFLTSACVTWFRVGKNKKSCNKKKSRK